MNTEQLVLKYFQSRKEKGNLDTMKKLLFIIIICLSSHIALAQNSVIAYTITPIPLENITDLKFTISITSEESLKINVLNNRFGTNNIHQYVNV